MKDFDNIINSVLEERDETKSELSLGEKHYNFYKKKFPYFTPEEKRLFLNCYGKVYENKSGFHDSLTINSFVMEFLSKAYEVNKHTLYSIGSAKALENNLPVYFLSKDFCEKVESAEVDKNILFEDLTLPFDGFFYMLPKGTSFRGKEIYFINIFLAEDDIYSIFTGEGHVIIPLRDILTRPSISQNILNAAKVKDEDEYKIFINEYINFITAVLLFHQTAGFDKTVLPVTPLPLVKNATGKIVPGQRKRVSANVIDAPQISYEKRKPTEEEESSFKTFYKGYYQTRTHIRIKKNKTTGEIKIIGVSSSETNPHKKPESVNFQKRKLSDDEIQALVKTNKDYIINKLKLSGYSDSEINDTLKKYNLGEQ